MCEKRNESIIKRKKGKKEKRKKRKKEKKKKEKKKGSMFRRTEVEDT